MSAWFRSASSDNGDDNNLHLDRVFTAYLADAIVWVTEPVCLSQLLLFACNVLITHVIR